MDHFEAVPFEPPTNAPAFTLSSWFDVPSDSPIPLYLYRDHWDLPGRPQLWEAARLTRAIYLYREKATQWTVLVKFYREKVSDPVWAERHATNEFECTRRAQSFLPDPALRAPRTLARRRDVLFLEHVDGLTLEDAAAIRRTRPGMLLRVLEDTARLLASLHVSGRTPESEPDLGWDVGRAHAYVGDLSHAGVLKDDTLVSEALHRLIDRWAADPAMAEFVPGWIHGDATTSNFIVAHAGGLVAIDWERMREADPASEVGRLLAEVTHAILRYGGNSDEASEVDVFTRSAYAGALPDDWDADALLHRSTFHQASSTLRIARNGWLTRLERMGMVAQAMALLA
ncbi:MAG: aminoglycoside phosphotransferase family protein [Actinomycetales bacterium]|nr:aminoglycoside phosphotransferase family protein [Actinomycetales bacterium]